MRTTYFCSTNLSNYPNHTIMRKTLLMLLLAFGAANALQAQDEYSTLVVETTEGTRLEISLEKKPEVKMTAGEFVITCGEEITGYTYGQVRKFYFITPQGNVGIASPTVNEDVIHIEYRDHTATIHGVNNPEGIQLYTANGKRIAAATSSDGTAITVSLSSLAPGMYILDIDGKQSFKLLKR